MRGSTVLAGSARLSYVFPYPSTRRNRVSDSHFSAPSTRWFDVDTGMVSSLPSQRSKTRRGRSSLRIARIHCVYRPPATVSATLGDTKYFTDTRGETPSQSAPDTYSPRSPPRTSHLSLGFHRSSTNSAPIAGRWRIVVSPSVASGSGKANSSSDPPPPTSRCSRYDVRYDDAS